MKGHCRVLAFFLAVSLGLSACGTRGPEGVPRAEEGASSLSAAPQVSSSGEGTTPAPEQSSSPADKEPAPSGQSQEQPASPPPAEEASSQPEPPISSQPEVRPPMTAEQEVQGGREPGSSPEPEAEDDPGPVSAPKDPASSSGRSPEENTPVTEPEDSREPEGPESPEEPEGPNDPEGAPPSPPEEEPKPEGPAPGQPGTPEGCRWLSITEATILTLINRERGRLGLQPLTQDKDLAAAARIRAAELYRGNYVAHTRPGGEPWETVLQLDIPLDYAKAAENLAWSNHAVGGEIAAFQWFEMWRQSESHYAAMTNERYTCCGIAVLTGPYFEMEDQSYAVSLFCSF